MLNFYDFIQVFVFTRNHHLNVDSWKRLHMCIFLNINTSSCTHRERTTRRKSAVQSCQANKTRQYIILYFIGYKTEVSPSKTMPKIWIHLIVSYKMDLDLWVC